MTFEMVAKKGWLQSSASGKAGDSSSDVIDPDVEAFVDISPMSSPVASPPLSNFVPPGDITLQSLFEIASALMAPSTPSLEEPFSVVQNTMAGPHLFNTAQAAQPIGPRAGAANFDTSSPQSLKSPLDTSSFQPLKSLPAASSSQLLASCHSQTRVDRT